jgi:tetratricopeptide (TPR) repeat protein
MRWPRWILILLLLTLGVSVLYRTVEEEWVLYRRAAELAEAGAYAEAGARLAELPPEARKHPRVLALQGEVYLKLDRPRAALAAYRQLLRRGEPEAWLLQALAGASARAGEFDAAAAYYHRLLEAAPEDRHARLLLARMLTARGDFDAAVREYRRALRTRRAEDS